MKEAPAALSVAERACRTARGDGAEALVHAERSGFARFAASSVHQPTLVEDLSVTIRVVRDGKVGVASTNRTDDEGLRAAARRAAEAADRAEPDPFFTGPAPSAEAPDIAGFDEETAALTPDDVAARAWAAIDAAPDHELYGYFTSGVSETAVTATSGLAVSQAVTDATIVVRAAREGESGYADGTSWRARDVDGADVARAAAEKAARSAGAERVEAGVFRAVLEPYAVAELLWHFGLTSLGALALLERRSYLAGRLGEQIFDPALSIVDDALDPRGLPTSFDFEGVPKRRVTLVDRGVARDVVWDLRTAQRAGKASTGHGVVPLSQSFGPIPFHLTVPGGDTTVDELAERVGDGIYVTRLHYVNVVDAREGLFTGMTRDGTFRIRDGRVAGPLVNLRFTTSFPALASGLLGLSRETRLVNQSGFYGERHAYGAVVPSLATERFTVVGSGSAPGV